jgi:hypothetical protein
VNELSVIGLGAWSQQFSNWEELVNGLRTGRWQTETVLEPSRIAARERRRAPKSVKMAVEVMTQACDMARVEPQEVATVFSSSMGDMQITDYLCRSLASPPREISPTRFHNSVHNAPNGYWSIATGSHAPASAVSAFLFTAPVAFLEAAIQVVDSNGPVLLVTQEMAAPLPLRDTCPAIADFAAAILLAPPGYSDANKVSVRFATGGGRVDWPELPETLKEDFFEHPGARLLPFLAAMASPGTDEAPVRMSFPLSQCSSLMLSLTGPGRTGVD